MISKRVLVVLIVGSIVEVGFGEQSSFHENVLNVKKRSSLPVHRSSDPNEADLDLVEHLPGWGKPASRLFSG